MKTSCIPALLLVALLIPATAGAQPRVQERDLDGTWRMVFDLKGEGETAGERVLLNAIDGLMAEIDIRFEFQQDGVLKVITSAFDEPEPEVEYGEWSLTEDGWLVLEESEAIEIDDALWTREGRRLVAYEREGGTLEKKHGVYMVRVRD